MSRLSAPFANTGNVSLLGSDQTLYVETTGNDTTGDGSSGAPFATLQRAFDEVPDGYNNTLAIQMGIGTFSGQAVLMRNLSYSGYVQVIGDRSAPTLALSSPSFSLVSGRTARYRATGVGAHGGLGPSTHWFERAFGSFITAKPVADSVSGELDIPGSSGSGAVAVHPFATTLAPGFGGYIGSLSEHTRQRLYLIGVEISPAQSTVVNATVVGCKTAASVNLLNCDTSSYLNAPRFLGRRSLNPTDNIFDGQVTSEGDVFFSNSIMRAGCSVAPTASWAKDLAFSAVDFDGTGAECIDIGFGNTITFYGDVYCDPLRTRFLRTNGKVFRNFGALVAGSGVAGADIVTLQNGAHAVDISTFLANVTGENMKVGDNASALISGITFPVTDLGAANPHMCRAT